MTLPALAAITAAYIARSLPRAIKSVQGYVDDYIVALTDAAVAVFNGDSTGGAFAAVLRGMITSEADGVYIQGMIEGGYADEAEADDALEDEDYATIAGWQAEQRGYVAEFAKAVAAVRRLPKDEQPDAQEVIFGRIAKWGNSLRNLGDLGRARARGDIFLTFDGDDGKESCPECQKYKGQRHKKSWWAKRNLLERNGNPEYDCGRWDACNHHFYDDNGDIVIH